MRIQRHADGAGPRRPAEIHPDQRAPEIEPYPDHRLDDPGPAPPHLAPEVTARHPHGEIRPDLARERPGVNVNRLLASGPGSFDPLSNMAYMTGIPVDVRPVDDVHA